MVETVPLRRAMVAALNELSSRNTVTADTMADLRAIVAPELVETICLLLDELTAHGITESACGETDVDGGPTAELLRYAKTLVGRTNREPPDVAE